MIDPEPVLKSRLRWVQFYAATHVESQDVLCEEHIKFRPNRPRVPHRGGKVERSQRIDRMEFWATIDLKSPREQVEEQLALW